MSLQKKQINGGRDDQLMIHISSASSGDPSLHDALG